MICQIVENGGLTVFILCLITPLVSSFIQGKPTTIQEFCSDNSFIRNIEAGELFELVFKSEQQPQVGVNKWYQKSKRKCRQEFKTSDAAAHFNVAISNMDIPSCDDNCRCNYFEIAVSGHSKRYCGIKDKDYFSSKSDKLTIEFHYGSTMRFDVSLTFTVERNVYIITGAAKDTPDSTNFIETPYFPIPYPPTYRAEYILQSNDPASHVLLVFVDFQISPHSFIEVVGNNGTRPTRFYGDVFRPPVIVSQFSQLTLKFQSSDEPGMPGFRALSSFIKSVDTLIVPYTDCAESKDGRGGFINIKTHERFGLYDCVWHIVPFTPFSKSNLSIFTSMRSIGHKSILEFRQGRNSKSQVIKAINCKDQDCNYLDTETIIPASEYLYIRFNGYLDVYSVFNLSYSTFHMGNCSDKEFKCQNGRCLLIDFKCDGVPHCPDGSDEEFCPIAYVTSLTDEGSSVQSIQRSRLHNEDTLTYFVLVGCLGLVSVLVTTLCIVYNLCCKKPATALPVHDQTPGELTDVQPTLYPANSLNSDNPPSYDDFIKSSNFYPPLLYTRASQRLVSKSPCSQCTTSFCSGARVRHYSADSFAPRNSDTSNGDIFLNISGDAPNMEQSVNPSAYNVEIIQNNLSFKPSKNTVKRSHSLDSKLNDLVDHDTCHLLLSFVRPCTHDSHNLPQVQWYTLPPNFKYSSFKNCNLPKMKEPSWLHLDSKVNLSKDRRLTWSFIPRSSAHSELVTVVKTRCFSEPCTEINIHCSLY